MAQEAVSTTAVAQILLVEDDPSFAALVREVLRGAHGKAHALTWEETLGDGLQAVAQSHFDLIVSDLSLPDAQGAECARRLSEAAPQTPVVILSGYCSDDVSREALDAGAWSYIGKGDLCIRALSESLLQALHAREC